MQRQSFTSWNDDPRAFADDDTADECCPRETTSDIPVANNLTAAMNQWLDYPVVEVARKGAT